MWGGHEGCREWMGVQSGSGVTVELYAQDGADIGEARGTGLDQHLGYSNFCHMAACPQLCSLSASRGQDLGWAHSPCIPSLQPSKNRRQV